MCAYDVFRKGSVDAETAILGADAIWKGVETIGFDPGTQGQRASHLVLSPYDTGDNKRLVR